MRSVQLHITQHKRFVPYGTHPNFCFAKTSFMLRTLHAIGGKGANIKELKIWKRNHEWR